MNATVRLLVLLSMFSIQSGCHKEQAVPVLQPIARISAKLHPIDEFLIQGIEHIDVPENDLSTFSKLVVPTSLCTQEIKPHGHYLVADVLIEHKDGSQSKLIVRWTGHNPAAVSFDGIKYFYGGLDEFPDGATRIIRLLREYDFRSQKSGSKPSRD